MKKLNNIKRTSIQKNILFSILTVGFLFSPAAMAAAKAKIKTAPASMEVVGINSATGKAVTYKAPKVAVAFNPATIITNEFVSMAISFTNANAEDATFTSSYIQQLPEGMMILGNATTTCGGRLVATKGTTKITLSNAKIPGFGACQILMGVTATKAASFDVKVAQAALHTDHGFNTIVNGATLLAQKPPQKDLRVKKTYNPANIKVNEFTTMSIALTNPNAEETNLEAPFSEYLPDGMVIVGAAKTTCKGKLTAQPGTSKVILTNARIPAFSSCEILMGVIVPDAENPILRSEQAPMDLESKSAATEGTAEGVPETKTN